MKMTLCAYKNTQGTD